MLASVWWSLGGGARVGKIGEVLQIFLHYLVLKERHCGMMKKEKENAFFVLLLLENVVLLLLLLDQSPSLVSLVTLVLEHHQGAVMCSHTCHVA